MSFACGFLNLACGILATCAGIILGTFATFNPQSRVQSPDVLACGLLVKCVRAHFGTPALDPQKGFWPKKNTILGPHGLGGLPRKTKNKNTTKPKKKPPRPGPPGWSWAREAEGSGSSSPQERTGESWTAATLAGARGVFLLICRKVSLKKKQQQQKRHGKGDPLQKIDTHMGSDPVFWSWYPFLGGLKGGFKGTPV